MRHEKSNETGRYGLTLVLVVSLTAAASACGDWPYPLENPWDSYRCEQDCQDGESCYEEECVPTKDCSKDTTLGLTFCSIRAGPFKMGSPNSDTCRYGNEPELLPVTLTRSFEIQTTEVTQDQFFLVMDYRPSSFSSCGGTCPVELVSWHEAAAYCNALSGQAGLTKCYTCSGSKASVTCQETAATKGKGIYTCTGYRLPTEAEWEYAYRSESTTAFYNGDISSCSGTDSNAGKIGWYSANSGTTTHPMGKKDPNKWGLYDMAGNVWEWCHDGYQSDLGDSALTDPVITGSSRVLRGGSWSNDPSRLRAAYRDLDAPTNRGSNLGFRCSRTR